jgi:hypothetical protein
MCCFSAPVKDVSATKIFARLEGQTQFLAYAMNFSAAEDLAMILPIPTPPGSAEDVVKFLNLEEYPTLFGDLAKVIDPPIPTLGGAPRGRMGVQGDLTVHSVGAFEASFVPSPRDLDRLDPRFKFPAGALAVLTRARTREDLSLSEEEWTALPDYSDWGFCVFKLKKGEHQKIHPLAFRFPTRWPKKLFFPTVHVHDGRWTPQAQFDHNLYLQLGKGEALIESDLRGTWIQSFYSARIYVAIDRTQELVDGGCPVFLQRHRGMLPNCDVLVALSTAPHH